MAFRPIRAGPAVRMIDVMAVIEVNHLHKRYRDQIGVHDVSFQVQRGEIFGVLGPNGAGKTTTVECVGGLRQPDGGTVRVLGLVPGRDTAELRAVLGMQLQRSELPGKITVREAVELFASFYRTPAEPGRLIDECGLTGKRNTSFATLSGGQRRRLSIALALAGRPQVVILDELTAGLDPQTRRDTWVLVEQIRDTGVTVVLVTHVMAEAERLCDRIAVLDVGRVVAVDSPAGLVARVSAGQRLRFRPLVPVDDGLLTELPEVSAVRRNGVVIEVTGRGELLYAVTSVLARHRIIAADLRVEQANLDDVFLALTGRDSTAEEQG